MPFAERQCICWAYHAEAFGVGEEHFAHHPRVARLRRAQGPGRRRLRSGVLMCCAATAAANSNDIHAPGLSRR